MICAAWPEEQQIAARAAFERRDPFGQRRDGRVGQARVDVAHFLQVEELGGVVGVAEDIGGGLVDRHLPRAGGRVGCGAGMDLQACRSRGVWSWIVLPKDAGTLGGRTASHNGEASASWCKMRNSRACRWRYM